MASDSEFPVLILSGTVGVGKSAVLVEIHDILTTARVPHACIDRDALAYSWPTQGAFNRVLMIENVAAVCSNFRRAGVERLAIASLKRWPTSRRIDAPFPERARRCANSWRRSVSASPG